MAWDMEGSRTYRDNLKPERLIGDDQVARIMKNFGVPHRYLACRLEKIPKDGSEYRKRLEDFVENLPLHDKRGFGLVLIGPYGSGKTGAAAALIYEVGRRWGRCRFVSARDLGRISNDYGRDKIEQWSDLRRYQFVVLDEVGCEQKDKDTREAHQIKQATEDLIRHRYDAGLMTVITTNMVVEPLLDLSRCIAVVLRVQSHEHRPLSINYRVDVASGLERRLHGSALYPLQPFHLVNRARLGLY